MQLEPIIKKNTELQVIFAYELGEDQILELPGINIDDSQIVEIKCDIIQRVQWYNNNDVFITNISFRHTVIEFRKLDYITHIYFYQVLNGIECKSKNIYPNNIKL